MDIQKLAEFNGVLLIKEELEYGSLAGINFLDGTINVLVEDENDNKEIYEGLKLEDVELVEFICTLGEDIVLNRDIISIANQNYEIEILEDRNVMFYLLNSELERVVNGNPIPFFNVPEHFERIANIANIEIVGNMFEIDSSIETETEKEDAFDFDVKIAKRNKDGYIQYLYACNNKKDEQIDLITVVFVGAEILDNTYERETISYDEFELLLESGKLEEVGQGELRSYAYGLLSGAKNDTAKAVEYEEEDDENSCDCIHCNPSQDVCQDCGEFVEDCDCL